MNIETDTIKLLGRQAVDKITGLKGVVTAVAKFWHQPPRLELTPRKLGDGGKPIETQWLDLERLELGKSLIRPPKASPVIAMGEEVTDSLTRFSGVVTAQVVYINGCLRYEVTPKTLKDGKPIDACSFDEQRLTDKSKAEAGGPFDGPPALSRPR